MNKRAQTKENLHTLRWLAGFSSVVCYISLLGALFCKSQPLLYFFSFYAIIYTVITITTFFTTLTISFFLLYSAINSGVFVLSQLLGSNSPISAMFFVTVTLPFFLPSLSKMVKFLTSFIIPTILYYTVVFLYPQQGFPDLVPLKPFVEPALMFTLFISIWSLIYLFERNRSLKNLAEEKLAQEQIWNQKLQEAQREAEKASAAKSQFLATLSHELKTPLHSVLGATEVLDIGYLDSCNCNLKEALAIIHQGAQKTALKIDQILDYLDLENSNTTLHNRYTPAESIQKLLDNIIEATLSQKEIVATVTIRLLEECSLYIDVDRLAKIVSPLLQNAVTYGNNKIALQVTQEQIDETTSTLSLTISDDGPGLSSEIKEHIFEPFVSGDQTYSRLKEGLGLGLTTVYYSLNLMKGSIQIEEDRPQGTIVTVTLQVPIRQSKVTIASTQNILIVDDTSANRTILEMMAQKLGYQTESAENGIEAVEKVQNFLKNQHRNYDSILMDLQMPKMDGFCATCKIRDLEKYKEVSPASIYAVSANSSEADRQRAKEVGMDGFYAKPLHIEDLKEALIQKSLER